MLYQSTRGGERGVPFEKVLLSAYASDGGLYVPESLPTLSVSELSSWAGMSMAQVCARVMEYFTDLPLAELDVLSAAAFGSFNDGNEPSLPMRQVGDLHYLDTGLGPTLAFKDIGQQVVAQLLNVYLGRRGEHANVIVETSGDTGPAAIAGVTGCANVDIFVLYPHGRITPVQELQMITVDAPNVHVYRTEGDTDENAEMLKLLFADRGFMSTHKVCSINSINWARIMVQSAYYVWGYLQLRPRVDGLVHFSVPTGAFGNAVGGLVAKTMGLPIGRIVCATNANDVVHRTITHGDMSIADNVQTISPAMDIQFAYNVERMLFYVSGGDTAVTARYIAAAQQRRAQALPPALLAQVQATFVSIAVSDEETAATMARVHAESGFVLDPHSAVGVCGASDVRIRAALHAAVNNPICCVLTAHPAKFEGACVRAGVPVDTSRVDMLKTMSHKFKELRAPPAGVDKLAAWATDVKRAVEAAAAARLAKAQPATPPRSRL